MPLPTKMRVQVDHHAAALRAVLGEVLDAERLGAAAFVEVPGLGLGILGRGLDVLPRAKAVVEHRLKLFPIPLGEIRIGGGDMRSSGRAHRACCWR